MSEPYNETHQSRTRPSTSFEDLLGDSIERAYAAGKHDLASLLEHLNQAGPVCPLTTGEWTENAYKTLMAQLGA